ncbi:hypothetical protein [Pararhizobium sp. DWP1-1-3]|uniref:hypothetical protein n=1 Tax=Pararhizobium sp. DWP1-1-3 TaxID=2804652 RepID=UPI003CED0BEC
MTIVPEEPTEEMLRVLFTLNSATPRMTEEVQSVYQALLNFAALSSPAQEPVAAPDGPFHVSRSSDGQRHWFSARDDASGVTVPLDTRERAAALVESLNRAFALHLSLAAPQPTHGTSATDPAPSVKTSAHIHGGMPSNLKTSAALMKLIEAAKEKLEAMTPAEQQAMWQAQRESWVRGEMQLDRTDTPAPPAPNALAPVTAGQGVEAKQGLALEKAIDFIESLTREPLLMGLDDIEMTLDDVQSHARIELASIRSALSTPTPKEESK